ncbi:hypothetical protein MMC28_009209 [Mycoblastus sanguinarius]|nr:hypothetical protein [Mycoblastus sanguinarius]
MQPSRRVGLRRQVSPHPCGSSSNSAPGLESPTHTILAHALRVQIDSDWVPHTGFVRVFGIFLHLTWALGETEVAPLHNEFVRPPSLTFSTTDGWLLGRDLLVDNVAFEKAGWCEEWAGEDAQDPAEQDEDSGFEENGITQDDSGQWITMKEWKRREEFMGGQDLLDEWGYPFEEDAGYWQL